MGKRLVSIFLKKKYFLKYNNKYTQNYIKYIKYFVKEKLFYNKFRIMNLESDFFYWKNKNFI